MLLEVQKDYFQESLKELSSTLFDVMFDDSVSNTHHQTMYSLNFYELLKWIQSDTQIFEIKTLDTTLD